MEIIPPKEADAATIYSTLVDYLRQNRELSKLVAMGFDGEATFSGDKTGVQHRPKKNSRHSLFVHCSLPLASTCVC